MRAYSAKEISYFNANIVMKDLIEVSLTLTKFHHINTYWYAFFHHGPFGIFLAISSSQNSQGKITYQDLLVQGPCYKNETMGARINFPCKNINFNANLFILKV